jgi:tetratricopeptide (TPR) repeat protein
LKEELCARINRDTIHNTSNFKEEKMALDKLSRFTILSLVVVSAFFITACGDKVTYRVTGKDVSTAKIVYKDADGSMQEELVDLPWETTIGIKEGFGPRLIVTNPKSTGEVTCNVWLNKNDLGQASSAINVRCYVANIRTGQDENPFLNFLVGQSIESILEHTQKLAKQGDLEKALENANEAVEAAPHYAGCYTNRAIVYEELGNLDAAKNDLLKAKELSDDPELLKWVDDKLSEY